MSAKIQVRRDTAANWTAANPVLLRGELGYEYDTVKLKIGDGSTAWNSLAYAIVSQTMVESLIAAHADRIDNPHAVTKAQVGLEHVDDISSSYLLDRTNHTGTQTASTISDFDSAADARITLQKASALGLATLDSGGKVPASQLPNTIMEFKGTWNASTNTPTLANGSGANLPEDAGHVYVCSVGGTVNFGAGSITFAAGDWVILSSSLVWEKSINSNAVVSVNGYQGVVVLTKGDVGLSNVSNTAPADLPISTATQSALNLKYDASNPSSYVNAAGASAAAPVQSVAGRTGAVVVTKSDVGLSLVDNVSASSLRDRSTHTGTQLASTISDFTTAVQGVTIDAAKIDGGVVSNAEFATLDGITTGVSIQSQLDGKEPTITGAASTITGLNLNANRAVVSDASGKIAVSATTALEVGFLSGVTSSVQTQLNGKQPTGNYITALTGDVTASGPGSVAATLSSTGVSAGTYDQVTVDTKGRVTAAAVKRYVYASTVQTTNNTITYSAVTGLTTASLPAGLYRFSMHGQYQSAATTTGVGVRISNGTATVTTCYGMWRFSQAADGVNKTFQVDQLTNAVNVVSASSNVANSNANVEGYGVFRVTVAGTMQIQLRSEVAASQVLLQPDAVLVVEQIA